jgi:hypothetical protein
MQKTKYHGVYQEGDEYLVIFPVHSEVQEITRRKTAIEAAEIYDDLMHYLFGAHVKTFRLKLNFPDEKYRKDQVQARNLRIECLINKVGGVVRERKNGKKGGVSYSDKEKRDKKWIGFLTVGKGGTKLVVRGTTREEAVENLNEFIRRWELERDHPFVS